MSLALLAAAALQVAPPSPGEPAPRHTPAPVGTEPGAVLPDVVLPRIDALDAAPLRLSSLRGRRVLLLQFASW